MHSDTNTLESKKRERCRRYGGRRTQNISRESLYLEFVHRVHIRIDTRRKSLILGIIVHKQYVTFVIEENSRRICEPDVKSFFIHQLSTSCLVCRYPVRSGGFTVVADIPQISEPQKSLLHCGDYREQISGRGRTSLYSFSRRRAA